MQVCVVGTIFRKSRLRQLPHADQTSVRMSALCALLTQVHTAPTSATKSVSNGLMTGSPNRRNAWPVLLPSLGSPAQHVPRNRFVERH